MYNVEQLHGEMPEIENMAINYLCRCWFTFRFFVSHCSSISSSILVSHDPCLSLLLSKLEYPNLTDILRSDNDEVQ